jgi:hypothetical protein
VRRVLAFYSARFARCAPARGRLARTGVKLGSNRSAGPPGYRASLVTVVTTSDSGSPREGDFSFPSPRRISATGQRGCTADTELHLARSCAWGWVSAVQPKAGQGDGFSRETNSGRPPSRSYTGRTLVTTETSTAWLRRRAADWLDPSFTRARASGARKGGARSERSERSKTGEPGAPRRRLVTRRRAHRNGAVPLPAHEAGAP